MTPPWDYLDQQERDTFRTAIAFLDKRLAEQDTIDWALRLKPGQRVERIALEHLLNSQNARVLQEPWATAWRLIAESWSSGSSENDDGTVIYGIQERLRAGERSGTIVAAIVNLVAPHLKVEPINSWRRQFVKKPRSPKTFEHLFSARLTSGSLVDFDILDLSQLTDIQFLKSLANALECAVNHGLDIARRIGWDEKRSFLSLGMLNRVYYTQGGGDAGGDHDTDALNRGIAPSVKLLHAVAARIADLDPVSTQPLVLRWSLDGSPVHVRLWAAMSRNRHLASADQVQAFLLALDDRRFWDLHVFPEIAELRATRFGDLDGKAQKVIAARIQKGPPRNHWPKEAEAATVKEARVYFSVRELKRIELEGVRLPVSAKSWLDGRIEQFSDLATMTIDDGFPEATIVRTPARNPDERYNTLEGVARVNALDTALSTNRGGWDDDPAQRANDWIQQPGNAEILLGDFEAVGKSGYDLPRVWDRFGWTHSPRRPEPAGVAPRDLQSEAEKVLAMLNQISGGTLSSAIGGVSAWLDAWKEHVVASPSGLSVWLRVWPVAVEETNAIPEKNNDADLSVTARAVNHGREPMHLDTLNPPTGKLVGVFLAACPKLTPDTEVFAVGSKERQMRDAVIASTGRSGLIARHRLIEVLPYFLKADPEWTKEHLIVPLLNDDSASLALWRAIARRTHFTAVLEIIGGAMAKRATDRRLGRETRQRLVFSLVVESLHAFREGREPALPNPQIQQMLRMLDDEVRASAANAIQQFVRELSSKAAPEEGPPGGKEQEGTASAAALFRSTAAPFLRDVWPQERSLATPGVSGALADLPATSGGAFADAVDTIERFLVPFECWSMAHYGFYGKADETKKLAVINDEVKAKALLRLLDLTVGTSEGAVIPNDLTDALDQIESVTPSLAKSRAFRRLSTAARR